MKDSGEKIMKLLSLNIWGGQIFEPLMEFFQKHSKEVDIFCLQEVFSTSSDKKESRGIRANIFQEITSVFKEFDGFFAPVVEDQDFEGSVDFSLSYGLAIFIRKSVKYSPPGHFFVYSGRDARYGHPRIMQYVRLRKDNKNITIANLHGLVLESPDLKMDGPERLEQSQKIREFLEQERDAKILCGDFNLRPDTESLSILEKDMANLIKTYNVATTRSPLYTRSEKFADYTLVSPEIQVKDFRVLQDVVSDHLPMLLEFT